MVYDALVIGKGPAGITASIYIKRAGYNTIVIGKDGGALEKTKKIENYYGFENPISGTQLFLEGMKQAQNLGVEIITDEVVGIEYDANVYIVKTRGEKYRAKTIIIATGTSRKEPKIKGIKEYEGKGVSYCAVCDAFFYRGKDVAVIGEGEYAVHEAKHLEKVANTVTILTNGITKPEKRYQNIQINEKEIEELQGENHITNVKFKDNTNLDIEGIFVAIGTASSIDFARKLGAIVEGQNIVVDKNMKTNIPGLYACGDCTGGILQIAKAVYEGMTAGLSAISYIRKTQTK